MEKVRPCVPGADKLDELLCQLDEEEARRSGRTNELLVPRTTPRKSSPEWTNGEARRSGSLQRRSSGAE